MQIVAQNDNYHFLSRIIIWYKYLQKKKLKKIKKMCCLEYYFLYYHCMFDIILGSDFTT